MSPQASARHRLKASASLGAARSHVVRQAPPPECTSSRRGGIIAQSALDPEERRSLVRALVAAEGSRDETIGDALSALCRALRQQIGFTGAVVNLMSTSGGDVILAAADDASRRVGELHFDIGDGPGQAAFERGRPVLVGDLDRDAASWPGYGPVARGAGVAAVFTFPLQVGASRFGLLTAYADQSRQLSEADIACCLSFAELATEMLIGGRSVWIEGRHDPEMVKSLCFRSEVYQAQGMVSVSLGLGLDDALATLRARAYVLDQDLSALAADVVAGRVSLTRHDLPPDAPQQTVEGKEP